MFIKCAHCGEFAVDDTENQEVCEACGIVAEEVKFSHTSEYIPPKKFVPFTKEEARLYNQKKPRLALTHGQMILSNLYDTNNIPSEWKADAVGLFKLIVSIRHFKDRDDAGVTAAACLFLIQRKHKQAITINTLCHQIHCTKGKFSKYLRYVKSCLSSNDKFKHYSYLLDGAFECHKAEENNGNISDNITSLIREVCNEAKKEEKKELMEKTAMLVKLADSCWLLTGRSPRSVVVASAYLCWKSMNPLRKKASFPKFCAEVKVREPVAKLRIPEIKELLLRLGKKVPSYNQDYVNEENLLFHLGFILDNSETLRNDLLPNVCTQDAVDAVEFSTFRYPPTNLPRQESMTAVKYDPDMNASDIEISDTEIESYIVPDSKKKAIELCNRNKIKL